MASPREYLARPMVGIGGVVIDDGKALLVRRGTEPLAGQWSIPGGSLELGETLEEGVARELLEETGLVVRVVQLIELLERIFPGDGLPRFHYVIADYLCERISGQAVAGSDVTEVAFVREEELAEYQLTEATLRVLHKAFRMEQKKASRFSRQPRPAGRRGCGSGG